jgi:hypothetical protein
VIVAVFMGLGFARLQPHPGRPPLLVVATGRYAGEGLDCPALDTLFLAAPVANKGSLTQYAGRIRSAVLREVSAMTARLGASIHSRICRYAATSDASYSPQHVKLLVSRTRREPSPEALIV